MAGILAAILDWEGDSKLDALRVTEHTEESWFLDNNGATIPGYIEHVLLFWYFDLWGQTDPGGTASPRTSQFLERMIQLLFKGTFHMQTNQFRAHHSPSTLSGSYTRPIAPYPNHTVRYQTTRDSPYAPEPTEITENDQSWARSATWPHPLLPMDTMETTVKVPVSFPCSLCLLTKPGAFLCGPIGAWHAPSSGNSA